ncbi:TIM barrel protein [Micrococcales bacterium 31B]|nr:TIM barrel protein [Micrococcales bacterium 31B]
MIGLGTYAFFWQHSERAPAPLSLAGAFAETRALGVDLFQICDYAPLDRMSDAEAREAARAARDLGLTIELGTKGIEPEHLDRYLALADIFDARLVRSMVYSPTSRPTPAQARAHLASALPAYAAAGVTLALETYEQIATTDLARLVTDVRSEAGSDRLGICLDPANVVARLELPSQCIAAAADLVANVHVKDFEFARQDGWVGFTYSGAAMGAGLHDYGALLASVRPRARGLNEVVEHWLPWQGDATATITLERDWTRQTLDFLRSTHEPDV